MKELAEFRRLALTYPQQFVGDMRSIKEALVSDSNFFVYPAKEGKGFGTLTLVKKDSDITQADWNALDVEAKKVKKVNIEDKTCATLLAPMLVAKRKPYSTMPDEDEVKDKLVLTIKLPTFVEKFGMDLSKIGAGDKRLGGK